jgi:hypothetical protein
MKHSLQSAVLALVALTWVSPLAAQTFRISRSSSTPEVKLDWLIQQPNLWVMTPDDLEKNLGSANFEWQDKERTHARFDPDSFNLTLNETKIGETLVNFKDGKTSSVVFSYVNKGDDGLVDRSKFAAAVAAAKKAVEKADGASTKEEKRPKNEAITKGDTSLWRSPKALLALEHLFLPEQMIQDGDWIFRVFEHAEYVRVRMQPPTNQLGTGLEKYRTRVSGNTLAAKVKREARSAIIEGIPMVNQGSKGYCAIATMERVLRYYGNDVDMHDLAMLANSSGGTDLIEMKKAVHEVANKLSLASKVPFFMKNKDMKLLSDSYNRVAKKAGTINLFNESTGKNFFTVADNKALLEMRTKSSDFAKFKADLVDNIHRGIPIMWALHLGLFWEDQMEDSYEANRFATNHDTSAEDSKTADWLKKWREKEKEEMKKLRETTPRPPEYMQGGHMRLIIGYDGNDGTLIYTDSWGPGHEHKKMKLEEAFAATMATMVLTPR